MPETPEIDKLGVSVARRLKRMPWQDLMSPDGGQREAVHRRLERVWDDLHTIEAVDPAKAKSLWETARGPEANSPGMARDAEGRSPWPLAEAKPAPSPDTGRYARPAARAPTPNEIPSPSAGAPEPIVVGLNSIERGRRRRREDVLDPALTATSTNAAARDGDKGAEPTTGILSASSGAAGETTMAQDAVKAQRAARAALLLEGLEKRYLHTDDAYHFRTPDAGIAFKAETTKLSTTHDDPSVATAMVDLAEARGWDTLKVKGSEVFRREVWMQGQSRGLDVQGYKPKAVDKARLAEWKAEQARGAAAPSTEPAAPRDIHVPRSETTASKSEPPLALTPEQSEVVAGLQSIMAARGDSAQAVARAAQLAAERFQTQRVYIGKIVETGVAPYQDKPNENDSPYIVLSDDTGRRSKIWGVDLPRAQEEAGVKTGDKIALAFGGRKAVTVDVPTRDAKGHITGKTRVETMRNTWEMVPFDRLREVAQSRTPAPRPAPTVASQTPPSLSPDLVRGQEMSR